MPPPAARIVEKHGILGTPVPGKPQKHVVPEIRISAGAVNHVTFESAETAGAWEYDISGFPKAKIAIFS